MKASVIVTCEHAGNDVPAYFESIFKDAEEVLRSHRGWDRGAYQVAEFLAEGFHCDLFGCHLTRLLIETNRAPDSPQLFSEYTKNLADEDKQTLITDVYESYRHSVTTAIRSLKAPVVHLSIHSFTPVLNDEIREADVGLLFDPERIFETQVCTVWKKNLEKALPAYTIRFNEPYRGTDDGFTTDLRKKIPDYDYAGIEVEINQKFMDKEDIRIIQRALFDCFPL